MKRLVILSLGVLLLGSGSAQIWAADTAKSMDMDKKTYDPEKMSQHRLEHLTKKLDLTADQQTKVKQILQDEVAQMKPLHEQMKAIHDNSQTQITALLTDDQKKKFEEIKAKNHDKMHKWGMKHKEGAK